MRLLAGVAPEVGENFFHAFVENLANVYEAEYAVVNELISIRPMKVRMLAFWQNGSLGKNIEYEILTTPCKCVYDNGYSYFPDKLQELFPDDFDLVKMGVHSYLGAPLLTQEGKMIGHICVLSSKPVGHMEMAEEFIKIFASRAASELLRLNSEKEILNQRENLKYIVDEQTKELQKAKEAIEINSSAKSLFLSRVSHGLRTPLNAILGFAQILQLEINAKCSNESKNHIKKILEAGWNLDSTISDVLDLSLIETGKLELSSKTVRIHNAVAQILEEFNEKLEQKNLTINFNPDKSLCITIDPEKFHQAVRNLILNAVKFSNSNGTIQILIYPTEKNTTRIEVKDKGRGIPQSQFNNIFEKFEKLESSHNVEEGLGIGLAITKRLIEIMGGSIGVNSMENKETVFWVELPNTDCNTEECAV